MVSIVHIIMLVLFCGAALMSFAVYASAAVGGDETLNAMRLVRVGAWTIAFAASIEYVFGPPHEHFHSPMLFVVAMLAFAEIVTGVLRFKKLMRDEAIGDGPRTVQVHR